MGLWGSSQTTRASHPTVAGQGASPSKAPGAQGFRFGFGGLVVQGFKELSFLFCCVCVCGERV